MKKLRFTKEYRSKLSEKLMDLGNFAAAGLILAQFVNGSEFSNQQFIAGLLGMGMCFITRHRLL